MKDSSIYLKLYTEKKRQEKESINMDKLKEEKEDINMQMFELRRERNKKLINEETFEQHLGLLNKKLEEIRVQESKYNNLSIDIERAEMRFREQRKVLESIDLNNLKHEELVQIFDKIKIIGEYDNGYKNIYIHFSYNVIDDTEKELLREEEIDGGSSITEVYKLYKREKIRKNTKTRYYSNLD